MTTFGSRLAGAIETRGRFCAGIDPHPALLDAWGTTDSVTGLERFSMTAVEALAGTVAAVKPQSAFFERHGSRGVAVLERVIEAARDLGALVVLDVKRGDIGSTALGYAEAYLNPLSPLAAHAVTVSPYLGTGSLDPFLDTAAEHDAGVFVLALTSNPEGPQVQHATTPDGRTVAQVVLDSVAGRNAGGDGLGSVGCVVGATVELPDTMTSASLDIGGPLLVPGIGAQGGTVEDVRRVFGDAARLVLPSSSREVLGAGPEKGALRDAALRQIEAFAPLGD